MQTIGEVPEFFDVRNLVAPVGWSQPSRSRGCIMRLVGLFLGPYDFMNAICQQVRTMKRSVCLPFGNEARDGMISCWKYFFCSSEHLQVDKSIDLWTSMLVIAMNVLETKNLDEMKLLLTLENSCFSAFIEKGYYVELGADARCKYLLACKRVIFYLFYTWRFRQLICCFGYNRIFKAIYNLCTEY